MMEEAEERLLVPAGLEAAEVDHRVRPVGAPGLAGQSEKERVMTSRSPRPRCDLTEAVEAEGWCVLMTGCVQEMVVSHWVEEGAVLTWHERVSEHGC